MALDKADRYDSAKYPPLGCSGSSFNRSWICFAVNNEAEITPIFRLEDTNLGRGRQAKPLKGNHLCGQERVPGMSVDTSETRFHNLDKGRESLEGTATISGAGPGRGGFPGIARQSGSAVADRGRAASGLCRPRGGVLVESAEQRAAGDATR